MGFVARPLGGIVFGHFGDRVGRKSMLMISLMLMGVPTVLIGLTPSYESIGYWGAVALVFCRFLQGLAVGGEWGGAVLMAVEHAPEGKKGLFGSLPQVGVAPGLILSSLAMGAVSRLPEADMLSWGWRLPFLASVFLLLVGWYIRAKVGESPEFQAALAQPKPEAPPLRAVLRDHKAPVLAALVACISEDLVLHHRDLLADLCGRHAGPAARDYPERRDLGRGRRAGHHSAVRLAGRPLQQAGDLHRRRAGHFAVLRGLLRAAGRRRRTTNVAMLVAFGVVYAAMYAQESSLFASMFPPEVRYTGISLAVQIGGAIGGGTAPLVATYLLAQGGGSPRLIVFYLAGLGVVAAVCGLMMRPYRQPLAQAGAPFASGRAGKRVAPLASR